MKTAFTVFIFKFLLSAAYIIFGKMRLVGELTFSYITYVKRSIMYACMC